MKVLLVDDSPTFRNIQKKTFAQLGHCDFTEAADGVEALERISERRPDLVLIDWNMPNMDGITLVRKIRETDKTLPLIMCTTEAEKGKVREATEAGVNNYLVKPFNTETLKEKVEATMAKVGAGVS